MFYNEIAPGMRTVTGFQKIPQLEIFTTGEYYPDMKTFSNGTVLYQCDQCDDFWILKVMRVNMTDRDFHNFAHGEVKAALSHVRNQVVLLFRTGSGTWDRAFYDPRIAEESDAMRNPSRIVDMSICPQITDEDHMIKLFLMLYDAATGQLKWFRTVWMPRELSNQIRALCVELQVKPPISIGAYDYKSAQIMRKYRTPDSMLKRVKKIYTCYQPDQAT